MLGSQLYRHLDAVLEANPLMYVGVLVLVTMAAQYGVCSPSPIRSAFPRTAMRSALCTPARGLIKLGKCRRSC